jgi:hypothetical protein
MFLVSLEHIIPGLVVYLMKLNIDGTKWVAQQADPDNDTTTSHRLNWNPLPPVHHVKQTFEDRNPIKALSLFLQAYTAESENTL